MTRSIKYSWSWLNTRRSMQRSWKGTEQSLPVPVAEGFLALLCGPLSFHLIFRTFRYHFIVLYCLLIKKINAYANRSRGFRFRVPPLCTWQSPWAPSWRWEFHVGPEDLLWNETSGIIQSRGNLCLLINSMSAFKWKTSIALGRTSSVYSIGG